MKLIIASTYFQALSGALTALIVARYVLGFHI